MANVKISELPSTTDVSTGDYIPVIEGGVTKKVQAGPGGGLDAGTVAGYGISGPLHCLERTRRSWGPNQRI